MNKSKIILASVGGVVGLASLVLAYLVWDALSVKGERVADLDGLTSSADRLTRLPVYPGPAGVKAYGENAATYVTWREEAVRTAAAGDMTFEPTTPPAFKTFLVEEAARLSALPGGVDGKLVKPGFPFGFKDYITGGVLPGKADLPRLQREWHDVSTVIEALAKAGVVEITDVVMTAAKPDEAKEEEKKATSRRDRRRNARNRNVKEEKPAGPPPAVSAFTIDFLARPAAFVNAVNAFVTAQRFIVVDSFSFVRETDEAAQALGGGKKDDASAGRGRRGRRGRRAAFAEEEKKEEDAGKKPFFTDPLTAAPLKVRMSFSVYDFRSLETKAGSDEKSEEQK